MEQPHKYNERVKIAWPGGPYDFEVLFGYAEQVRAKGWEDWLVIHGVVVKPEGPGHRMNRGFYVHPVTDKDGNPDGYALLPKQP